MNAKRWYVKGRVQGVGYRWFVEKAANELNLSGYTRNLEDGTVEVYAVGPPIALSDLAGRLWKGPPYAEVRGVHEQEAAVEKVRGFRIER